MQSCGSSGLRNRESRSKETPDSSWEGLGQKGRRGEKAQKKRVLGKTSGSEGRKGHDHSNASDERQEGRWTKAAPTII